MEKQRPRALMLEEMELPENRVSRDAIQHQLSAQDNGEEAEKRSCLLEEY